MRSERLAERRWRTLAVLVLLGAELGGSAGFLESLLFGSPSGVLGRWGTAAVFAVSYAVLGAAAGFLLGLVALFLGAVPRAARDPERRRAFWGSLLFSLVVLAMVGSYVNVVYLPTLFSLQSLLFDGALVALGALLWLVTFRAAARVLQARRRRSRVTSPLALSAAVLAVIVAVAWMNPGEGAGPPVRHDPGRVPELNILLVVVDALRADHLGCYGYERPVSPNIDRLAAEGVLFNEAYAQASRTKESTASMLTSLYPPSHAMARLGGVLSASATTMMEEMKLAGYSTAVISANPLVSPQFGLGRGVDFFHADVPSPLSGALLTRVSSIVIHRIESLSWLHGLIVATGEILPLRGGDRQPFDRDAASMNESFLSWLDGSSGRFFAYLHYMEPHEPYDPPAPYDSRFVDPGYDGPRMSRFPQSGSMMLPFAEGLAVSESARRNMIAQYDGSIAYFDWRFGELLSGLRTRGLMDDTAIILTSDHGEEFYDHSAWGHGQSLYQELIRVPLLVWYPRGIPGGRVIEDRVRHVDVLPTLLGAAGLDETADSPRFEGINLWTILETGSDPPPHLESYSEVNHGGHYAVSLISNRWKLIYTKFGLEEDVSLYDLSSDPWETTDLSDDHSEIAESMLSRLWRLREGYASQARESTVRGMDAETQEKLRALGYVE
jgi:arylsulfatase A-like enzyme